MKVTIDPIWTDNIFDMHSNSIYNVNNLILNDTASLTNLSIVQCSATDVSWVNGSFVGFWQ